MDADWDLLAVVRGCTTTTSASSASTAAPSSSPAREPPLLAPPTTHHIPPAGFEELQDYLYKPFPQENMSCTLSTGTLEGVEFDYEELQQRKQPQQLVFQSNPPQKEQKEYSQFIFGSTASATATTSASSIMSVGSVITPHIQINNVLCSSTPTTPHTHQRSKKRKNLQKRVCHVGAEGLSSDMWAWRKYGQKPIKGSPYPRGYYRCSSSKGCIARKQVERNRSDPKMFIITYTSEHNHPMPTHRNSLAGSTRYKPATEAAAAANPEGASAAAASSGSGSPVAEEKGDQMKEDYEDEMEFKDMVMNDDFFVGFEELDDSDGGDLDFFPDQIQGGMDMGCHLVGQQQ